MHVYVYYTCKYINGDIQSSICMYVKRVRHLYIHYVHYICKDNMHWGFFCFLFVCFDMTQMEFSGKRRPELKDCLLQIHIDESVENSFDVGGLSPLWLGCARTDGSGFCKKAR